jgi:hypothetical protein
LASGGILNSIRSYYFPRHIPVERDDHLMDRLSLSDALLYIFGPDARKQVLEGIFRIGAPIGGGCDFYKMTYDEDQKMTDEFNRCPAGVKDVNAPLFVKSNPLRDAAMKKTCQILADKNSTREHALRLANVDSNASVSYEDFSRLFFLFHKRNMTRTDDMRFSIAKSAQTNWAKALFEICVSKEWQRL